MFLIQTSPWSSQHLCNSWIHVKLDAVPAWRFSSFAFHLRPTIKNGGLLSEVGNSNISPPIPYPPFVKTEADSSSAVERARGSGAHLAWTLHNSASCFLKAGAENCDMHLPVSCSLSTSAVKQDHTANNGEKTLIQKLITLLNNPQSALEKECCTSVWKQSPSVQNNE